MNGPRGLVGTAVIGVAVVLVAGAVAIRSSAGAAPTGRREIRIDIEYSRFSPRHVEVAPGETVRFVVVNGDPIPHEFIVGDAGIQLVHEHGSEAHHPPRPGEISIPAGTTRSTTVTFDVDLRAGSTLFGCHLPGHYAYGMGGEIEFV
jgi:uncharacterized cupredoxin-like copper-binding protein